MRAIVALLFACGCGAPGSWQKFEPCQDSAITARITDLRHPWTRQQLYRVGRFLGMALPNDELIVRVCNGSARPVRVTVGSLQVSPCDDLAKNFCPGEIPLAPRQSVIVNRFRDPVERGDARVEVEWTFGYDERGLLIAR